MRLVASVADSWAVPPAAAVAFPAGASAGAVGCMPRNPYTAARSCVTAWARSAKTVANWVATPPSGVDPAATWARAASSPVCSTAPSSAACNPWRVWVGRSLTTWRTVAEVAFD